MKVERSRRGDLNLELGLDDVVVVAIPAGISRICFDGDRGTRRLNVELDVVELLSCALPDRMDDDLVRGSSSDSRITREILQFHRSATLKGQRAVDGFGFFSLGCGGGGNQRDEEEGEDCVFHSATFDEIVARRVYSWFTPSTFPYKPPSQRPHRRSSRRVDRSPRAS